MPRSASTSSSVPSKEPRRRRSGQTPSWTLATQTRSHSSPLLAWAVRIVTASGAAAVARVRVARDLLRPQVSANWAGEAGQAVGESGGGVEQPTTESRSRSAAVRAAPPTRARPVPAARQPGGVPDGPEDVLRAAPSPTASRPAANTPAARGPGGERVGQRRAQRVDQDGASRRLVGGSAGAARAATAAGKQVGAADRARSSDSATSSSSNRARRAAQLGQEHGTAGCSASGRSSSRSTRHARSHHPRRSGGERRAVERTRTAIRDQGRPSRCAGAGRRRGRRPLRSRYETGTSPGPGTSTAARRALLGPARQPGRDAARGGQQVGARAAEAPRATTGTGAPPPNRSSTAWIADASAPRKA